MFDSVNKSVLGMRYNKSVALKLNLSENCKRL